MLRRRGQAGDTLIEVLFAITVFALIVVSALAIMNQGSAAAQRSLEMSLVRQQIDNQAETLRYLHEAYVTNYQTGYSSNPNLTLTGATGQYYAIVKSVNATGAKSASTFNSGATTCPTPPSGSFILNPRNATVITNPSIFKKATTFAQLTFDTTNNTVLNSSDGIWIEAVRSANSADPTQANAGYIDFHIRACWDTTGLSVPLNLGTIVRLYEPRG
jgi:type II secretory pathway pseudopilin PulG